MGTLVRQKVVMALPGGLSVLFLVGLTFLFIGTLLHIIGQSTPEWTVFKHDSALTVGLWKRCYSGECETIPEADKTAALKVCEAFAILGIFACLTALGLAFVNFLLAVLGKDQNKLVPVIVLASSILALLFILICVIVGGAEIYEPDYTTVGYSFILCIIGGIFTIIGGVLVFVSTTRSVG